MRLFYIIGKFGELSYNIRLRKLCTQISNEIWHKNKYANFDENFNNLGLWYSPLCYLVISLYGESGFAIAFTINGRDVLKLINADLIDAKLANYDTSAQVSNKISINSVGFPDYANRTALTLGKEYTADENMYVIIDFTEKMKPTHH